MSADGDGRGTAASGIPAVDRRQRHLAELCELLRREEVVGALCFIHAQHHDDAWRLTATYCYGSIMADKLLLAQAGLLTDKDVRHPPARQGWLAPVDVRLDSDSVVYDHTASRRRAGVLIPTAGMLSEFRRLASADGQAIAEYAAEYGVLGLCEHGLVHTYCTEVDDEDGEPTVDNPADREPLVEWRRYSTLAGTLLRGALVLSRPHPVPLDEADLAVLLDYGSYQLEQVDDGDNTVERGRHAVALAVTRWLVEGESRLVMAWDPRARLPQLTIGAPVPDAGMFGGLGLQVALACARSDGVAICDGCGGLHAPTRQPRPDQRTYCPDCRGKRVPQRHADRDRRDRQRRERATTERGAR